MAVLAVLPASVAPVTTGGGLDQDDQDVGTAGPIGLLVIVVLLIAVVLLVRSMGKHLKKLPASFDPSDTVHVEVPDTPAELFDEPARDPGEELLDVLRRAPRAIEPPRSPQE